MIIVVFIIVFLRLIDPIYYSREFINDQVIERFEQLLSKQKDKIKVQKNSTSIPEIEAKYDEKICDERFVDRILLHKQYQVRV